MRKKDSILGHRIRSTRSANLSLQFSSMIILEAKQGDIEHGSLMFILTLNDILNEAIPAVTHVGKSGLQMLVALFHLFLATE